ncbi:hypothetical protein CERZMDRAFT_83437 [Cercospora zeae-maydis SCOH1-5]|uniref:Uncharacterized protein n=1 Tax=Cercospora zeae-maydis SCOH1-5 TaxID=717836 RepID=A0A6A6FKN6_9PEZI|nr:hypothetical protein CERZMDRAFT_83437 [Cercospora zeae-maydis SCOH1-5]
MDAIQGHNPQPRQLSEKVVGKGQSTVRESELRRMSQESQPKKEHMHVLIVHQLSGDEVNKISLNATTVINPARDRDQPHDRTEQLHTSFNLRQEWPFNTHAPMAVPLKGMHTICAMARAQSPALNPHGVYRSNLCCLCGSNFRVQIRDSRSDDAPLHPSWDIFKTRHSRAGARAKQLLKLIATCLYGATLQSVDTSIRHSLLTIGTMQLLQVISTAVAFISVAAAHYPACPKGQPYYKCFIEPKSSRIASSYCSSSLKTPVITRESTVTPAKVTRRMTVGTSSTVSLTSTISATSTATATAKTDITVTSAKSTITSSETTTVTPSIITRVETDTITSTTTSTSTATIMTSPVRKRAANPANASSATPPACVKRNAPCESVSKACSCLSTLEPKTTTLTGTSTVSITSSGITTVTSATITTTITENFHHQCHKYDDDNRDQDSIDHASGHINYH